MCKAVLPSCNIQSAKCYLWATCASNERCIAHPLSKTFRLQHFYKITTSVSAAKKDGIENSTTKLFYSNRRSASFCVRSSALCNAHETYQKPRTEDSFDWFSTILTARNILPLFTPAEGYQTEASHMIEVVHSFVNCQKSVCPLSKQMFLQIDSFAKEAENH